MIGNRIGIVLRPSGKSSTRMFIQRNIWAALAVCMEEFRVKRQDRNHQYQRPNDPVITVSCLSSSL
jgi:hypothetical protein